MTTAETLGEAYPREQERLRELLTDYAAIGPAGRFGHMMISDVLKRADQAVIRGDLPLMLRLFKEMQECQ